MGKAPSRTRGSSPKRPTAATVEEYLARVPEPARSTLEKVRATIRPVVPRDSEEVISYGIPAFKHKKMIVWYAAFAKHCSLFPTGSVIAKFKDELTGYTVSKGTIQFPLDKSLPASLIKKLVKARLEEIR